MKSIRKKLVKIVIFGALFTLMILGQALAADCNISASASKGSIEKGDTVTVSISLSSSETIGAFAFTLNYDSSVLTYVASSGDDAFCSGGNGHIKFVDAPYSSSASYSISFKAADVGTSSISLSAASGDILNSDYDDLNPVTSGTSVTVNAPREASSDNNLSSLKIGEGTLSPSFSADVTSYSVSVGAGVDALTISCDTSSPYAVYWFEGNSLSEGENTVSVVVKAETGDTKYYTISVTKAEATATPTPTTALLLDANNLSIGDNGEVVKTTESLGLVGEIDATVPSGFSRSSIEIEGYTVECLKQDDGELVLVQLSDGKLYVYDKDAAALSLYQTITMITRLYQISEAPENEALTGYLLTGLSVGGVVYPAYCLDIEDEYYLIYVSGSGWYQYDRLEDTIQRYDPEKGVVVVTVIPTSEVLPTNTPAVSISVTATTTEVATAPNAEKNGNSKVSTIIAIIAAITAVIFIILYLRERNHIDELDRDVDYYKNQNEEKKKERLVIDEFGQKIENPSLAEELVPESEDEVALPEIEDIEPEASKENEIQEEINDDELPVIDNSDIVEAAEEIGEKDLSEEIAIDLPDEENIVEPANNKENSVSEVEDAMEALKRFTEEANALAGITDDE